MKEHRKRKVERIALGVPLAGKAGAVDVLVRDVSILGCRLEHETPFRVGQHLRLAFSWKSERVVIECSVARCTLTPQDLRESGASAYTSGVRFEESGSDAAELLRGLIAEQVEQAFEEQLANARGQSPDYLKKISILPGAEGTDPIQMRRILDSSTLLPWLEAARGRGYVRWELTRGGWKRQRTREPEQPEEGFTIWAWESENQIELLQKAYELADPSFRSIIRLCAELSLIVDDTLPPQKFLPPA